MCEGVFATYRRISQFVMSPTRKKGFTHFLSIPVTGEEIKHKFMQFKEEVIETCKSSGIECSLFQRPEKLHLTLGMMALTDKEEQRKAAEVLEEFKTNVAIPLLKKDNLELHMKGVDYMKGKPERVNVLYGKVSLSNNSSLLQGLADSAVEYFCDKGLMEKQFDQVKLHVTLMNTVFRQRKPGISESEISNRKRKRRRRDSFDATTVLKMFQDYDFGKQTMNCIHLSHRHTKSADGYYQALSTISFDNIGEHTTNQIVEQNDRSRELAQLIATGISSEEIPYIDEDDQAVTDVPSDVNKPE